MTNITEALASRLRSHTKLSTKYAVELGERAEEMESLLIAIDKEANSWRSKNPNVTTDKDDCADRVGDILRDYL